ncbi:hypothetical protein HYT23_03615 [Candidatus Pacearchaeota archaeon]|nr:hypothetical protein [Candidatus Pacearchaeota archaeon]
MVKKKKKVKKQRSRPSKKNRMQVSRKLKMIKKLPRLAKHHKKEKTIKKQPIKKKPVKSPTGIRGFDKMTVGGFETESINLIAGGSGSGKTIFALQYLLEGVRRGEHVLYVTFEEKKEDFYANMKKFGWDLDAAEKSGKFFFLEYTPEKVKMMLDEGGGTIESMVLKYNISRLVLDSLTSFSLMFEDELSKRQGILGLFDIIRNWNVTSLLTVQHNPSGRKDRGISPSEFEADSITLLYYIEVKSERQRFVEVLKMRGVNHSRDMHAFTIKKGINVGKVTRTKVV